MNKQAICWIIALSVIIGYLSCTKKERNDKREEIKTERQKEVDGIRENNVQIPKRDSGREKKLNDEREFQRLKQQVAIAANSPCSNNIVFEKLLFSWYVGCNGCSRVPVKQIYGQFMINQIEQFATSSEISLNTLARINGACG